MLWRHLDAVVQELRLPHTRASAVAVVGAMAVAVMVAIKFSHTYNAVVAISLVNRVSRTS
jgi:site-specific recombinase